MGTWRAKSSPAIEKICYDPGIYPHKNKDMPDSAQGSTKTDKANHEDSRPKAALYVSCLINSLRPNIGFDCIKLIESVGFKAVVPPDQTCCGQPAYNGGHRSQAIEVAKHQISSLQNFDKVIVPSGSCAGMMINHYPNLFADAPTWLEQARTLADKTFELCQFLVEQRWQPKTPTHLAEAVAYHASCSCRRETLSHQHGETLLRRAGFKLATLSEQEVCCGFGGSFAAKFDGLSTRMGQNKLKHIEDSGALVTTAADLGCLLQLESLAGKTNHSLSFRHIAELLAATCDAAEAQP